MRHAIMHVSSSVACRRANSHFGQWVSAEKKRFVGEDVFRQAKDFAKWALLWAKARMAYSECDLLIVRNVGRLRQ